MLSHRWTKIPHLSDWQASVSRAHSLSRPVRSSAKMLSWKCCSKQTRLAKNDIYIYMFPRWPQWQAPLWFGLMVGVHRELAWRLGSSRGLVGACGPHWDPRRTPTARKFHFERPPLSKTGAGDRCSCLVLLNGGLTTPVWSPHGFFSGANAELETVCLCDSPASGGNACVVVF